PSNAHLPPLSLHCPFRFSRIPPPPRPPLFPYTTLFRSPRLRATEAHVAVHREANAREEPALRQQVFPAHAHRVAEAQPRLDPALDRKSTRLNSSHGSISYAVFCLKKKKESDNNSLTAVQ